MKIPTSFQLNLELDDKRVVGKIGETKFSLSDFLKHPATLLLLTSVLTSILVPVVNARIAEIDVESKRYQYYIVARGDVASAVANYVAQYRIGSLDDFNIRDRFKLLVLRTSSLRGLIGQIKVTQFKGKAEELEALRKLEVILDAIETDAFVTYDENKKNTPTSATSDAALKRLSASGTRIGET